MISFQLDTEKRILHVQPEGELQEQDFDKLTSVIDPFIEANGALNGIIIETPTFPGWDSLSTMLEHFKFVHDHHTKVQKVALVTNSSIADLVQACVKHFVAADIRHFPYQERVHALAWIEQGNG